MSKEASYDNFRIISLDGSQIYRHAYAAGGASALTALKDGKLDEGRFGGILDASLDTDKLCEVYKAHKREMPFPFTERGNFTRAVVNVSFDYAVKEFEQHGRRFVRYGYDVADADIIDHVCLRDVDGVQTLIAIEIPYANDKNYVPVTEPLTETLLGKYFLYDEKERAYRLNDKHAFPSAVKRETIRETLYRDGFDIDGVHYVRYKRSAGSSRDGRCLFIAAPLYRDMMDWSACGLSADAVDDQASWQAYISLTLSSTESIIRLPKKAILLIPDRISRFTDRAVCVKSDPTEGLVAYEEDTEIENKIWDGEALLDVSVFEENGYGDKGMMLLRNRFFKTCAFNTNLQKWFSDNGITQIRQLGGFTVARAVSDIRLVITDSSLKYLKFTQGQPLADGFRQWLDRLYEGKTVSAFGVVKTDKPPTEMSGHMAYTNYKLLNTLAFTREGVGKFLEPTFDYLNKIQNDSMFMRFHIKRMSFEVPPELGGLTAQNYRRKTVLDMMCLSPDFENTELYKDFRSDICGDFKERLKDGRVLVDGNYETLFGNPYEFLCAVIDKDYQSTEPLLLEGNQVYTTRFEGGANLLCVRSPHITMGNLYIAENICFDELDTYFNLTDNIICVNAIGNNLQHRLNGCDYDSDSMLVTDNPWLYQAANSLYSLFGVPVCKVEPCGKAEYTSSPESLALLDRRIAENRIGDIVNLSQFLNSLLWDHLSTEGWQERQDFLYDDICKLAVLSGMEIDKAKRLYDVDTNKVLSALGKYKTDYKKEHGGLPDFFLHLTGQPVSPSGKYPKMKTGMAYLYDFANGYNRYAARRETVPLADLFDFDTTVTDSNDSHRKQNIIEAAKSAYGEIKTLNIRMRDKDSDTKKILAEQADKILADCRAVVERNAVNDHVLSMVLRELDNKDSRYGVSGCKAMLFACLLYEKSGRLRSRVRGKDEYEFDDLLYFDEEKYPYEIPLLDYVYGHPHMHFYIPKEKK